MQGVQSRLRALLLSHGEWRGEKLHEIWFISSKDTPLVS